MRQIIFIFLFLVFSPALFAKGDGRSFDLVGKVTRIGLSGPVGTQTYYFKFTGVLWVSKCIQNKCSKTRWYLNKFIGIKAIQNKPFFSMTKDWRGGSIGRPGKLEQVINTAYEVGKPVRMELVNPVVYFGFGGIVQKIDAYIIRMTDFKLK